MSSTSKRSRKNRTPAVPQGRENALRRRARRLAKEAFRLLRKRKKHLAEPTYDTIHEHASTIRTALRNRPRDLCDLETIAIRSVELDKALEEHLAPHRKSVTREYVESILWAIAIALFIRAFFFEAFQIPTGSMLPTLRIGDHLFVSKYLFGIRLPWTHVRFFDWRTPKRGEIVVFEYPGPGKEHGKDFIKRVVAVGGDRVRLVRNRLFIDGQPLFTYPLAIHDEREVEAAGIPPVLAALGQAFIPQSWSQLSCNDTESGREGFCKCTLQYERNGDHGYIAQHYASPCTGSPDWPLATPECPPFASPEECLYHGAQADNPHFPRVEVPEGAVLCMGDNRDNSADGRAWGFVPLENVKGKAFVIWWPFSRLFTLVH